MTRPYWSFRRPVILGAVTLLVLLLGFGLWASESRIAGAIVAPGTIEVEQRRQVVQHPDGGVVAEIRVSEGERVAAGSVLLRLDDALLAAELAIVEGRLHEILARRARLEAERDGRATPDYPAELLALAETSPEVAEQIEGQTRLFHARSETAAKEEEQLQRQAEQIRAQIAGIDAQTRALASQLALIVEERAAQQALFDKGLAQSAPLLALRREEARLEGQTGGLLASRAQAEERLTEIDVHRTRLAATRREGAIAELREIGPMELELAARRRALQEQIARLEIRAPVDGVVMGLQVTTPRAVIRAAEPLMQLVPQDRPLVIVAQIPPIHIDQVHPGQRVELVLAAFSSRTTPHLKGHVTTVSPDAFTDQNGMPSHYRAEIALEEGETDRLGGLALLPGMPVEAFLQTEERSPLAWLIQPFTDYFRHAMRES